MKKFLSAMIVFCAMIFSANCQAKVVRVADIGAENFYNNMEDVFRSKNYDIELSSLNFDEPGIWSCYFGKINFSNPTGKVIFKIDSYGYVSEVTIVSALDFELLNFVITAVFYTIDINEAEYNELLRQVNNNTQSAKIPSVWSNSKNRNFNVMCIPLQNMVEYIFSADDGRN